MAITYRELMEKLVPASAKVDKIDNQWLPPAEHDKKLVKAMTGDAKLQDTKTPKDESGVKDISKDKSAPVKNAASGNPETPKVSDGVTRTAIEEDYTHEALINREEMWELIEEITEILEDVEEYHPYSYCWASINNSLREVRNNALNFLPSEGKDMNIATVSVSEEFNKGKVVLADGTKVSVTESDAKALNTMLSGTTVKEQMVERAMTSKTEFRRMLTFAREVVEQIEIIGDQEAILEVAHQRYNKAVGKNGSVVGSAAPAMDSTPEEDKKNEASN